MKEPLMADLIDTETHGEVALIALNNPPVNAMGVAVRSQLAHLIEQTQKDAGIKAIVLTGRGRCFCGGADIREFGKPRKEPFLTDLINQIEECKIPVVAAIHATAVGGGCEIALGCHYRVGDASAKIGLPEIKLGLLPGAGGTQRLPRIIGIEPALDIILSGNYIDAEKAHDLGFFDEIIDGDLVPGAIGFANTLIAQGKGVRRTRDIRIDAGGTAKIFTDIREKTARMSRGLIAPERCIDAVEAALTMSLADGQALERKSFDELVKSDQSKAQRYLFFAQRQAHKIPDVPADITLRKIQAAAIVGSGIIGQSIAISLVNGGISVAILKHDTDYDALKNADIVFEAAGGDMTLKKQIFAKLDNVCKPGAILATSTSSLDIDEIAAFTQRPEDVIGIHFISHDPDVRLMENVRGEQTADDVIATVMKLSKDMGKIGVMVKNGKEFVGNRMLRAYRAQAKFMLEEGVLHDRIDKIMYDFGFPGGPCEPTQALEGKPSKLNISDTEILQRCLFALINEGAKILGENIAIRPSDIDLIWIFGYGFPIGRGGPMFYGDLIGTKAVYETLKKFESAHGDVFKPAPLLEELATAGKSFADWQSQ